MRWGRRHWWTAFEIVEGVYFWCDPAARMVLELDVIDLEHGFHAFRDIGIEKRGMF
jgi:hypothetical protein